MANMADMVAKGPVVSRPMEFACEERRAIHQWSRRSSAGHDVLQGALQILSPMSHHDLSHTHQLLSFLQELSEEGHRPTVLRSKDVYAYRSCMACPLTQDQLRLPEKTQRPSHKRRGKRVIKKREVHPSWNTSERRAPRIQGVRPPELLVDHRALVSGRTPIRTEAPWAPQPQVLPCIRLTNIEGTPPGHTARLQIHTTWDHSAPPTVCSPLQTPPSVTLSGIPPQPSQNGTPPTSAVSLFSQKSLSCPVRLDAGALIGDSAPVFYSNGRVFPQTHTELTSNGWRGNGLHAPHIRSPKDSPKWPASDPAAQRNGWKDRNGLGGKVIKVDESRSVAEACTKAQKVLQVNLSPVIQIQPFIFRDFRHHSK